jgi:alkaline phosphatase D
MWDDHDYCGNGSDDRATGRPAARAAYELYAPHYPLEFQGLDQPICQAFTAGRVRFIVTDLRSQRDPASAKDTVDKSMLGAPQKEWLKKELLAARDSHALTFWVSSVPWGGSTQTNHYWPVTTNDFGYLHHSSLQYTTNRGAKPSKPAGGDSWAWYSRERTEIADFIRDNRIRNLILLHGDMHALAADDGSNSDFATGGGAPIPVFAAAPLDRYASIKGGPYSQGVYKPLKNEGCFGLVDVEDHGSTITVRYSGRSNDDLERIRLHVAFDVPKLSAP